MCEISKMNILQYIFNCCKNIKIFMSNEKEMFMITVSILKCKLMFKNTH